MVIYVISISVHSMVIGGWMVYLHGIQCTYHPAQGNSVIELLI